MARKLKAFLTSIGFFDLAVAAPSMKAAAEAWGADPDIFRQGHAAQTDDPAIVKAATAAPGVVLKRPVGSHGKFARDAGLPKAPKSKPKTAKADSSEAEDEERQRDQARREQIKEKAEAAFDRAEKRHEDALRSLDEQRDEIAKAEAQEDERWAEEQRVYNDAIEAAKT